MSGKFDDATRMFLQRAHEQSELSSPALTMPELRERAHRNDLRFASFDFVIDESTLTVPARDGSELRVDVYAPAEPPIGEILYFHGGGWVFGELDFYADIAQQLAVLSGCRVYVAEYRKAPEHRFPTAAHDAIDVWEFLAGTSAQRGSLPLVVMGDSAGGNLAAVVVQHAPLQMAMQVLIYPVVSAKCDSESYLADAGDTLLSANQMRWFWDKYLPEVESRADARAALLDADEIVATAPTLVVLAEHDVLFSEGEAYAQRLAELGTQVKLLAVPGQIHGFMTIRAPFPAAYFVLGELATAIRSRCVSVGASANTSTSTPMYGEWITL